MGKEKEITVPDVLIKLSSIFTKDMYLVNNMYCIGGYDSEDENVGKSICILSPNIVDIFTDYFGTVPVIYFENIKKAKTSYGTEDEYKYIKSRIEDRVKKQIIDTKDSLMKNIDYTKGWNKFNFTEEEVDSIMNEGNTVVLFKNTTEIPDITVSKSIFPLIKSKDFNDIYYSVSKARNLKNIYTLIINYDHKIFQFYNIISYLKESKKATNLKSLEKQYKK